MILRTIGALIKFQLDTQKGHRLMQQCNGTLLSKHEAQQNLTHFKCIMRFCEILLGRNNIRHIINRFRCLD